MIKNIFDGLRGKGSPPIACPFHALIRLRQTLGVTPILMQRTVRFLLLMTCGLHCSSSCFCDIACHARTNLCFSLSDLYPRHTACVFKADAPEEDEDEYQDDDEDFSPGPRRSSRGARRKRPSSAKPTTRKIEKADVEEDLSEEREFDSDSDGEWQMEGRRKHSRRPPRSSRSRTSKRGRTNISPENETTVRAARVNSRTGVTVNYFEGDDDFLDSEDEAALKELAEEQELDDDDAPHVDLVFDYRLAEGKESRLASDVPFADFHVDDIEFHIKWKKRSFRNSTWETWETLKNVKGAKRVSNYIRQVVARRDFLLSSNAMPEDIAETRIAIAEHRVSCKGYEVVERIVAQRETEEEKSETEFLVKWANLSYCESTWEPRSALSSEADLKEVDAFIDREQSALSNSGKKVYNPFNTKDDRPKFKRMLEQPDFLHGEGRVLRDYQLAGLNFMAFSWTKRNNVILADEMGLGKTLQSISFVGWLVYARSIPGPYLVIVPLSTIAAWVREFARWLPDLNVICYTGNAKSRAVIREHEFYSSTKHGAEKFQVLLTTPELLMQDQDYLDKFRYAMIVVDEAHRLKNETSSLHITLANVRSANRLLITGTPLQNSVRELWALLHFLNPSHFTDADEFEKSFSFTSMREPERVSALHSTLRPYMVRRQKNEVEKSLPSKTYSVVRVKMTSSQEQYYRWLLTKNVAKIDAHGKSRGFGSTSGIRNLLMELKKCCNHLFLFPDYEDTSTPTSVNDLIRASGKMRLLDMMLLRLREKGHRVLIFSQMVRMLDILQDYCRMRNFPCQRLDGNVANEARQRAVDHFNAPDSLDYIFLLSTRAGGLGINLATADTVIIFDSDWNPQNDLQAESRAHRIGQTKDVKVIRLLCRETVEEDILERAKRKRVLEHLVIHGVEGGSKADGKEGENAFKKEELSAILRFGAEKLFAKETMSESNNQAPTPSDAAPDDKDEKGEEKKGLEADDIDALLERAPTDETSEVGADQPSIGASLLNAFKWNDFDLDEDDEDDKAMDESTEARKKMAEDAANRMTSREKEILRAKEREDKEREKHAGEGDNEFWERVIPKGMREDAIANDVLLGTRRRKRTEAFIAGSPRHAKRKRVTRTGHTVNGRVTDIEELTDKEQRSLLRSFKKFGDPELSIAIVKDAGLQERVDDDFARSIFNECLSRAQELMDTSESFRNRTNGGNHGNDNDPDYHSHGEKKPNGKESKNKTHRVTFDCLGEKSVDAKDLLKRCRDLQMLRSHIMSFDVDTQFRLRNVIKPPSYNVRWKPQNDAMLLIGICRHGFGNWASIALDKQLGLGDKIQVTGNPNCKPGAPDTTKLSRRVTTLLRELEDEINSRGENKRPRDKKTKKSTDKSSALKTGKKIVKKKKPRPSKGGRSSQGRPRRRSTDTEYNAREMQLQLKRSHLDTLKELRSLSKEDNDMDSKTKIKKTKQCLIRIGQGIEEQLATISSTVVREDLWRYVHEVCRTNLDGQRLREIYERIAAADSSRA